MGARMPSVPSMSSPFDRTLQSREVIDNTQNMGTGVIKVKKGGYIKAADGCAQRGKTKGRLV